MKIKLIKKRGKVCLWTYKEDKRGNSTESTVALDYPITRAKFVISTWIKFNYLKYIKKTNPKKCEMCGEAIATTSMFDPNYPSKNKIMYVCKDCPIWVGECLLQH